MSAGPTLLVPGLCDNECFPCVVEPPDSCCTENTEIPLSVTFSGWGGCLAFANGTYNLNAATCLWDMSFSPPYTPCNPSACYQATNGATTLFTDPFLVRAQASKSDTPNLNGNVVEFNYAVVSAVTRRTAPEPACFNANSDIPFAEFRYGSSTSCLFANMQLQLQNVRLTDPQYPWFTPPATVGTATLNF